jgi:hypothetical protein
MICKRLLVVLGLCCLANSAVLAQPADAPGPVGGTPAALPDLRLPSVQELRAPLPRTARAATALAGLGRQRLALVLGLSTIGNRVVVAPAARDAQAVATALRSGGFVVMRRDDVSGDALRAALAEFRSRLQPDGVGFVYVAALGAQVAGANLLLPRDTPLVAAQTGAQSGAQTGVAAALTPQQLLAHGVPLAEVAAALAGPPESLRILVVDAAYRHPALAALPQPGLAEQALPPGVMALFGHGLHVARDVPATAPLPEPAPADPVEIAATPFAGVLAGVLTTPRISGPQALLSTRRAVLDATQGRVNPWLGGETDGDEELAEPKLLDALLPRTPEDVVSEGVRQAGDRLRRQAAVSAGERSVADVLAEPAVSQSGAADGARPGASGEASPALPEPPAAGSLGSTVGGAANAVGSMAAAVGGGAATGAAVAAGTAAAAVVTASEAAAVASVAGNAVGTAGAVAGQAAALMSPGASSGKVAAGEALRPLAAAQVSGTVAAPATASVVPAAADAADAAGVASAAGAGAATADPATVALAPPALRANPGAGPNPGPRDGTPSTAVRTVRRADGGERPVFVPRRNDFGYAQGDTFSYQIVDQGSEEVTGTYTNAIEEVLEDGRLLANGQQVQMDAQGRFRIQRHADGSVSEFVPVQDLWWSRPKTGEIRDVGFTEIHQRAGRPHGETEWQGSSHVGTSRRIETPAGAFEVLPIESRGSYRETLASGRRTTGLWSRTVYYSTELGHPVAIDILDANRLGRPIRRERVELTHAQTSRDAP